MNYFDGAVLDVVGLQKRYGDIVALANCDLRVEPGQLVGFLGPNGAGKTTTMRSIMGLVSFDAGAISWGGEAMATEHRSRIGYLPQERGLYDRMQVHEQIAYFGRLAGVDEAEADRRAEEWVERVELTDRRDELVQNLSVGNQQRVQLAVALVHQPQFLILDEPFAGLDPVAVATMQAIITDQVAAGAGVLFSSHQLELVQDLCEDIVVIADGTTVANGTVKDLRASSDHRVFEALWVDDSPDWVPPVEGVEVLPSVGGYRRYSVPTGADSATILQSAATAGALEAFRFEPPGLDDVFIELVEKSRAAAAAA